MPGVTNSSISDRLVLITSFAQGFPVTETLISEGQYIRAAAILKQDYEIVARLSEVRAGKAKRGIQPNVKHAPTGSQRFYGELNAVAHPANEHILVDLLARLDRGDINGLSPIPEFNRDIARSLYELHVFTLLEIVREALQLYAEMYPNELEAVVPALELFRTAVGFVEKVGFVVESRSK